MLMSSKIMPDMLRGLPQPNSTLVAVSQEPSLTDYEQHADLFTKYITVPEPDGLQDAALGALYEKVLDMASDFTQYASIDLIGGPGSVINIKEQQLRGFQRSQLIVDDPATRYQ
jgi:hypothetical protein